MFWSVVAIFGACEFGARLSEAFNEIDIKIHQLEWYRLPADLWHMLPILIVAAQQPVELHAIGSISCGRLTFRKVCEIRFNDLRNNFLRLMDVHT